MSFEIDKPVDEFDLELDDSTKLMVIGVGGGGGNAVSHMVEEGLTDIDYVVVNTDVRALRSKDGSKMKRIQIGRKRTKGQGAGNNPLAGQESAEENHDELAKILSDISMVFIAAGMGGGTGTGAAPVVASIAKELGILTVGVVTKPFKFEGDAKMNQALKGIEQMRKFVDALVIIPNEKIKEMGKNKLSAMEAFKTVDNVLYKAVKGISDLVTQEGYINTDFADVTMVLKDCGLAHMAIGTGKGDNKITDAINEVINSPLLETSITGASRVLVNISVPRTVSMDEVDDAMAQITKEAAPDALIKIGVTFDDALSDDEVSITVIATAFKDEGASAPAPAAKPIPVPTAAPQRREPEVISSTTFSTSISSNDGDIEHLLDVINNLNK